MNKDSKIKKDKKKKIDKSKEKELKDKTSKKDKKSRKERNNPNIDYSSDSSDEDMLVRTGDIPRKWYKDFDHLGYSQDGKKVEKQGEKDEIEKFLLKARDKDWWRNITDEMNNKTVYLSDKDLEIIRRIKSGLYASEKVKDDEEYFERDISYQQYPLSSHSISKRAFLPSLNERKQINRLARLIEDGIIQIKKEKERYNFFSDLSDIWKYENSTDYHPSQGFKMPKPDAPDNDISYNFNDPEATLRKIPRYEKLIEDQYDRLNDIYQSVRVIRKKQELNENDILPSVPSPEELKPFPTKDNITHKNHGTVIEAIAVDQSGDFVFTGDTAGFIYFSDLITSKVLLEVHLDDRIMSISYNQFLCVVSVCCESGIYFFRPKFLERKCSSPWILNKNILPLIKEKENDVEGEFTWKLGTKKNKNGMIFSLHRKQGALISQSWHHKGDFFALLSKNELGKSQIHIFSLSNLQNYTPISKNKGDIRAISFHPSKPQFYVCSDSNVLIYDLKQQELVRKFVSNLYPINLITLHPLGADFVCGGLAGKVAWFQSDLSEKPYLQMDQYHETKIKALTFSNNYNLLCSASKEGKILLYYSKVYDDLIHDPLIVPLTTLSSFYGVEMKEVNGAVFHPVYPWLLTAGSNKKISVWS